jgi:hypothetical protein
MAMGLNPTLVTVCYACDSKSVSVPCYCCLSRSFLFGMNVLLKYNAPELSDITLELYAVIMIVYVDGKISILYLICRNVYYLY